MGMRFWTCANPQRADDATQRYVLKPDAAGQNHPDGPPVEGWESCPWIGDRIRWLPDRLFSRFIEHPPWSHSMEAFGGCGKRYLDLDKPEQAYASARVILQRDTGSGIVPFHSPTPPPDIRAGA